MGGLNVRDVYPDLDSYPWEWLQLKVKRYWHPSGAAIDLYVDGRGTFSVTPAARKGDAP